MKLLHQLLTFGEGLINIALTAAGNWLVAESLF